MMENKLLFSELGKTAIVAGSGRLPLTVIEALLQQGSRPFVVFIRGNSSRDLYERSILDQCDWVEIAVSEISLLIKNLKKHHVVNIVLAGGIKARPKLRDINFDWLSLRALKSLWPAFKKGDDALLTAFIMFLENCGFRILGAQTIVPDLLAPTACVLTYKHPSNQEKRNLLNAIEAAKTLGSLDIGQAAVAVGGRVVALEGPEGTDNMLQRVAEMRQQQRIAAVGGVLVKAAKPSQELRVDLPTIGLDTLHNAYKCGLSGLAVEAQRSFILERAALIAQANKYGMFVTSFALVE